MHKWYTSSYMVNTHLFTKIYLLKLLATEKQKGAKKYILYFDEIFLENRACMRYCLIALIYFLINSTANQIIWLFSVALA